MYIQQGSLGIKFNAKLLTEPMAPQQTNQPTKCPLAEVCREPPVVQMERLVLLNRL